MLGHARDRAGTPRSPRHVPGPWKFIRVYPRFVLKFIRVYPRFVLKFIRVYPRFVLKFIRVYPRFVLKFMMKFTLKLHAGSLN